MMPGSQVVRQRILIPPPVGSNPTRAKFIRDLVVMDMSLAAAIAIILGLS